MTIACGLAVLAALCGPVFPEVPQTTTPPRQLIALGGGTPGRLAVTESRVWATVYGGPGRNRLVGIDAATRRVFARVPVQGGPYHVAAGAAGVWVTGNFTRRDDVIQRVNPAAKRVVATIPLPGRFAGPIAVGRRSVWVIATDHEVTRQWLVRIDADTNEVVRSVPLGAVRPWYVEDLDVSHGSVWLLAVRVGRIRNLPGDLLRFDPRTNRVTARINADALDMEAGPGGVWITGCVNCRSRRRSDFAQRVDPRANRRVGPKIGLRRATFGPLFAGRRSVWFGGYDRLERTIAFSIDPGSGEVDRFLRVAPFLHAGMGLVVLPAELVNAAGRGPVAE